jgi:hypothetical protein
VGREHLNVCEGGEYDAVLKSPPWCWQKVSRLFLEYHSVPGRSFEELRDHLHEFSLELVWRSESAAESDLGMGLGMAYFRVL